jgi:hypothetical protein
VLEALCAFVREGTIGMVITEAPATDIQATLTVVRPVRLRGTEKRRKASYAA